MQRKLIFGQIELIKWNCSHCFFFQLWGIFSWTTDRSSQLQIDFFWFSCLQGLAIKVRNCLCVYPLNYYTIIPKSCAVERLGCLSDSVLPLLTWSYWLTIFIISLAFSFSKSGYWVLLVNISHYILAVPVQMLHIEVAENIFSSDARNIYGMLPN